MYTDCIPREIAGCARCEQFLFSQPKPRGNQFTKIESVGTLTNTAKRKLVFGYDHLGRRIKSQVHTNKGIWVLSRNTRFVCDGWNLLAELNAASANAPGLKLAGCSTGRPRVTQRSVALTAGTRP